jgi:hypothetical protein
MQQATTAQVGRGLLRQLLSRTVYAASYCTFCSLTCYLCKGDRLQGRDDDDDDNAHPRSRAFALSSQVSP